MARRLSAEGRAELERRRDALRMELRLVEAELRGNEVLRLQDRGRARPDAEDRGRLRGRWRGWVS